MPTGIRKTLGIVAVWLLLLGGAARAEIPCIWTGVERVVAVGDLHGDYKNFVQILQGTGIVDGELRWAGGTAHLVQTGDIMDRGDDARQIFNLLMRLEKEAEAAGGRVHCLLGNHEEMNMSGIAFSYPEYVTVGQFVAFLPDDYIKRKETEFLRRWRILHPSGGSRTVIPVEDRLALWKEVMDNDAGAREEYLDFFQARYGKWIAGHNAVIKINDTVFVHGGISQEYSLKPLSRINDEIRLELGYLLERRAFTPQFLYARNGPLWYRELAQQEEAVFEDEVNTILANLQAGRIVIAHTVVGLATVKNMRRFGGKVWIIDTGISAYYQGQMSALIIDGTGVSVWGVRDE